MTESLATPVSEETLDDMIDRLVRPIEDWPAPGVTFRDITPLLADPQALSCVIDAMAGVASSLGQFDAVLGIEARGFLFGPSLALKLGTGFVPVRKAGKLPSTSHSTSYDLEYGSAVLEIHTDALQPGARVLVVDDVLATGGTMRAAADLVRQAGATVGANLVLIDIEALGGRAAIGETGCVSLHSY